MMEKISDIALGIIPGDWLVPVMVNVFPDPVHPNAKMVVLYPFEVRQ